MAREKRDTKTSRPKPAHSGRTSAKESAAKEGQGRQANQDLTNQDRSLGGNQGEGNREADRRYREAATNFERSGRVPKAAEDARRAVEDEDRKRGRDDDDIDVGDYDEERVEDEEARREARDLSRLS